MTLQRQLLFVSLCLLVLPWAGCQYIQTIESTLRDGQAKALAAHAQAIATTIAVQAPQVFTNNLPGEQDRADSELYFFPLNGAPIIDGYSGDWTALDIEPRHWRDETTTTRVTLFTGSIIDTLYVFFSIKDATKQSHNPQQQGIANGDHVILYSGEGNAQQTYYLRSSGSGNVTARYFNQFGEIRQEHRIRGIWQETREGYTVELAIPKSRISQSLAFHYVDHDSHVLLDNKLGNKSETHYNPRWIETSALLNKTIAPYTTRNLRISVLDTHNWIKARQGTLNFSDYTSADSKNNSTHWLLAWFYKLLLGDNDMKPMTNEMRAGYIRSSETTAALKGNSTSAWYRQADERIGRVAHPITIKGQILGAVIVEQNTEAVTAATNAAFNQLLLTVLGTMGIVALALILYASVLSWRIKSLSTSAKNAIGNDGRINTQALHSNAADEIGDLTRNYADLLHRLNDYTEYLRSLASKLSHELRTPLAVIKSSLDNLNHSALDEKAMQYQQRASEGADRLSTILNAMSAANRIEESIQQSHTEHFPLDELLSNVVNAYNDAYPNQSFTLSITKYPHYNFVGSPDLLVQMLDKLVDNAADFATPNTPIIIELCRTKRSQNKELIEISVSNSGPLLPAHMQGQLFDSLVSVRDTSDKKKDDKNTTHLGLGLYIVRLIVDFHSGDIMARNREDESGVIFTVQLPTND
ncbi:ATP-binding protein [Aurantivibrio plasticivorans]